MSPQAGKDLLQVLEKNIRAGMTRLWNSRAGFLAETS